MLAAPAWAAFEVFVKGALLLGVELVAEFLDGFVSFAVFRWLAQGALSTCGARGCIFGRVRWRPHGGGELLPGALLAGAEVEFGFEGGHALGVALRHLRRVGAGGALGVGAGRGAGNGGKGGYEGQGQQAGTQCREFHERCVKGVDGEDAHAARGGRARETAENSCGLPARLRAAVARAVVGVPMWARTAGTAPGVQRIKGFLLLLAQLRVEGFGGFAACAHSGMMFISHRLHAVDALRGGEGGVVVFGRFGRCGRLHGGGVLLPGSFLFAGEFELLFDVFHAFGVGLGGVGVAVVVRVAGA